MYCARPYLGIFTQYSIITIHNKCRYIYVYILYRRGIRAAAGRGGGNSIYIFEFVSRATRCALFVRHAVQSVACSARRWDAVTLYVSRHTPWTPCRPAARRGRRAPSRTAGSLLLRPYTTPTYTRSLYGSLALPLPLSLSLLLTHSPSLTLTLSLSLSLAPSLYPTVTSSLLSSRDSPTCCTLHRRRPERRPRPFPIALPAYTYYTIRCAPILSYPTAPQTWRAHADKNTRARTTANVICRAKRVSYSIVLLNEAYTGASHHIIYYCVVSYSCDTICTTRGDSYMRETPKSFAVRCVHASDHK